MLQRLLMELTRPQASTKDYETMKTSDFLKAFYEDRQLGSAPLQPQQQELQDQMQMQVYPSPQQGFGAYKPSHNPNLLAPAKIPHTASSGAAPYSTSTTHDELLHEARIRELTWKHAGTQSVHRSLQVTESESLRLRPKGDARSGAVDPVAVLPQITRQPLQFRPSPNTNRSLDPSGPPQYAPSPGRTKSRGRGSSAPGASPSRSPPRSPSPAAGRASSPATPGRMGVLAPGQLAPLLLGPPSPSSCRPSTSIPLSPINRPPTSASLGRARGPASPTSSRGATPDPSLSSLGEFRTEIDDYLSQLFAGGAPPLSVPPYGMGLSLEASLEGPEGRKSPAPAFPTVYEAAEGEYVDSEGGAAAERGEGQQDEYHQATDTSNLASATSTLTATAAAVLTTTSASATVYLPWKIAPHIPTPPAGTAVAASSLAPPVPTDADLKELQPVCCQLVEGLYRRAVVVSLLASKKPAWKVDAVQLYDPRLFLAPIPPPPDKMVIKVSDIIESTEMHVTINVREYVQLLYDLVDKHPSLDIASHLQPSSLDWWRDAMRYVIKLRSKPDGSLLVKISKGNVERLVVSRAACVDIEGAQLIGGDCDLTAWMAAFYSRFASREKEARERAEREALVAVPAKEPRGPVLGPATASSPGKKVRSKKRAGSPTKAAAHSGGRRDSPPCPQDDGEPTTGSRGNSPTDPLCAEDDDESPEGGPGEAAMAPSAVPLVRSSSLPKISATEVVARKAITNARINVSSSSKFRSRPMTDIEIALIHSPFAVPLVTEKMKREKERIQREQGLI